MGKINMDSSTIYIGLAGEEPQPLGKIKTSKLISTIEKKDATDTISIISQRDHEATLTIIMTKQQMESFMKEIMNITRIVLEILRGIGNKRVAYLAKHAKKRRTRKKNISRAYRIVSNERSYTNEQA